MATEVYLTHYFELLSRMNADAARIAGSRFQDSLGLSSINWNRSRVLDTPTLEQVTWCVLG